MSKDTRTFGPLTAEIRLATQADAQTLFVWANDPAARAASTNCNSISWEQHIQWLAKRLQSPDCRIWIMEASDGRPVGQIRYELNERKEAVVSFTVEASQRSRGYGTELIRRTLLRASQMLRPVSIVAICRKSNLGSAAAFLKNGFSEGEPLDIEESEFRSFSWKSSE